ncbi:hypothetical protein HYS94_00345 [Candidatus Daviesbacteria bacterium]|nr:hypothetical protein [Candidatus Daviesbacteria bacterium]
MTIQTEARPSRDIGPTARLQFKVEPDLVPWIYSSLMNEPEVELFNGEFPEPFKSLTFIARQNQNQLVLIANLEPGPEFNARYGHTIGSFEDLTPFLLRYPNPKNQFTPDGRQLFLYRDDQVFGAIGRPPDGQIIIQRGGPIGQLQLSADTPVNDLAIHLDQFNLLVQRYVSAIWKASPETDQKEMHLVLSLPALPDGASRTYLSTFELMAKEFSGHPRPVRLDDEIGGYPMCKALMRSLFLDLTQPEISRSFGTQPHSNKFVLITGEEGTGKSLFPKALDAMLRSQYPDGYEYLRLPLEDILPRYGPQSVVVVKTLLDHVSANERNGVPTLLHVDHLEELVPPYQRDDNSKRIVPESEFQYTLQTRNPIVLALREFGSLLGAESHHVVVYGESRVRREDLPEGVRRTFRRTIHLKPTVEDLADTLRIQIRSTRQYAEKTPQDPFSPDIETHIHNIAQNGKSLVGRDIQQAIINIATRHKAAWVDGGTYAFITPDELSDELNSMVLAKGDSEGAAKNPIGFHPYHHN